VCLTAPSTRLEELRQQLAAGLSETGFVKRHAVIQAGIPYDIPQGTAGAGFGVGGTKDQMIHTSQDDRTRTHRAGLQGHGEQSTWRHSRGTQATAALRKDQPLCVSRGIRATLNLVMSTPHELAVGRHKNSAHRHFRQSGGPACVFQGPLHRLIKPSGIWHLLRVLVHATGWRGSEALRDPTRWNGVQGPPSPWGAKRPLRYPMREPLRCGNAA
jgi:hypothetical protein